MLTPKRPTPKRSRATDPWTGRCRRAQVLPQDDAHGGWTATLAPPPPPRRLDSDVRADCAVLGAGFTGLAAARRLAELRPDWRIAVLDAQRVGDGTSGRSSGFVVDLATFIQAMPEDESRAFVRLSRAGIAELRARVEGDGIDCDWDERGWMHIAAGDVGMRSLEAMPPWVSANGQDCEWIEGDALEKILGTRFYRAALRLPGSVLVQGAKLVRGLAAHLPENAALYEESPVRSVERRDGLYHLQVGGAAVRADRLVVALNGYSSSLGFLKRRVVPLLTFGTFTRPLTDQQAARLGGESEWGILAQDPMGSSLRRLPDGRLLVRNSVHYSTRLRADARHLARIRDLQRQCLLKRYPQLDDIELEPTWAGLMGITPSLQPFFGRIADGAVAAGGFTGAGIAMGTICGRLMAELLVGTESDLLRDIETLPGPRWVPPEPARSLGVKVKVARMNASGGEQL